MILYPSDTYVKTTWCSEKGVIFLHSLSCLHTAIQPTLWNTNHRSIGRRGVCEKQQKPWIEVCLVVFTISHVITEKYWDDVWKELKVYTTWHWISYLCAFVYLHYFNSMYVYMFLASIHVQFFPAAAHVQCWQPQSAMHSHSPYWWQKSPTSYDLNNYRSQLDHQSARKQP